MENPQSCKTEWNLKSNQSQDERKTRRREKWKAAENFPFHELHKKKLSPATFRFHLHVNVSSSVNKKLSANAVRVVLGFYVN